MIMKPENFICEGMEIEVFDYAVRPDNTIAVIYEVHSDLYDGDLELTREEIYEAMEYAQALGFDEVNGALYDGLYLLDSASKQADPRNPDLEKLLFDTPPAPPKKFKP
jgi:hypothetical protein